MSGSSWSSWGLSIFNIWSTFCRPSASFFISRQTRSISSVSESTADADHLHRSAGSAQNPFGRSSVIRSTIDTGGCKCKSHLSSRPPSDPGSPNRHHWRGRTTRRRRSSRKVTRRRSGRSRRSYIININGRQVGTYDRTLGLARGSLVYEDATTDGSKRQHKVPDIEVLAEESETNSYRRLSPADRKRRTDTIPREWTSDGDPPT